MTNAISTSRQHLYPNIRKKITQWLSMYVKFAPDAYQASGELRVSAIQTAFCFLIDQRVFDNTDEIKQEFAKVHRAIIPDFLFAQEVPHEAR